MDDFLVFPDPFFISSSFFAPIWAGVLPIHHKASHRHFVKTPVRPFSRRECASEFHRQHSEDQFEEPTVAQIQYFLYESIFINIHCRTTVAVGKIMIYTADNKNIICFIRIDKAIPLRTVIPAAQIVQLDLPIVDIAAITEGIALARRISQSSSGTQQLALCFVLVFYYEGSAAVKDAIIPPCKL